MIDTALTLRLAFENKQALSNNEINNLINNSKLVARLTGDYENNLLFAIFRIVGLSEIPYIERLPYTMSLIDFINQNISTKEGFSFLGGIEEIVPCYNAMVLEAYCRLGLAESPEAQAALNWIKRYQLFDRNKTTAWKHKGVCKHGGCLGKVPCYIGIGKTVRALITYSEFTQEKDDEVENLIINGVGYMLRHKMYQRLSNGKPISPHITDIMMPQNYALSFTDLVYIVGKTGLLKDKNSIPLISLLREKQVGDYQWKLDYLYTYKGYIGFDNRRKASTWISSLFSLWLAEK